MAGQPNRHLIYTALYETFFTYVKVGMFAGLCLSFPVIASQIWMFVAPGLYRHERRAFLPFLLASPVLFIVGAAFVFYVMLPTAIHLLRSARRYAIVGIFAIAAVFTPPDLFSMISLAVPLVGLYEISIWCVALIERRRAKQQSAEETAEG